MNFQNYQEASWGGEFGDAYRERNNFSVNELNDLYRTRHGVSRTDLNHAFLSGIVPQDASILEVGCNIGNQLLVLQTMGYTNLSGIELNAESAQLARERTGCPIIQGSATNLPFKNKSFDLVFTSGVLIHINPSEQVTAMSEIARVSKKWIWLLEYYSENLTEVEYRGKESLLWKNNFAKLYETFTGAMLKDEILLENIGSDNLDQMALLEVAE